MIKKIFIISLLALALPVITLAYYAPATLTDGVTKVIVYSQSQASTLFARGYSLFTGDNLGSVTSNIVNNKYFEVNGDGTYHINGTFLDASTTIVSVVNPFGTGVTSTIDMMRLYVTTGATSSATVTCGANPSAQGTNAYTLLTGVFATSTNKMYMENNLTAALGGSADGGTVAKITLTPTNPYMVCKIAAYGGSSMTSYTQTGNTFAGKYQFRVSRLRY